MSIHDLITYIVEQDSQEGYENLLNLAKTEFPKNGIPAGPSDLEGLVECLVEDCGWDPDDLKDVADGY